MKTYRAIALLLIGAIVGAAACIAFCHIRRAKTMRALPSLSDRNHLPLIDELTSVTLIRRDNRLDLLTRDGMGGHRGTTRQELEAWLAVERKFFGAGEPLIAVNFEPGVTMEDLDDTLQYLGTVGVHRFFIGYSFYGKSIQYHRTQ